MLHMPGAIHSPAPLAPDAFQMPKADDDFHSTAKEIVKSWTPQ
jgi:hypothetical protein